MSGRDPLLRRPVPPSNGWTLALGAGGCCVLIIVGLGIAAVTGAWLTYAQVRHIASLGSLGGGGGGGGDNGSMQERLDEVLELLNAVPLDQFSEALPSLPGPYHVGYVKGTVENPARRQNNNFRSNNLTAARVVEYRAWYPAAENFNAPATYNFGSILQSGVYPGFGNFASSVVLPSSVGARVDAPEAAPVGSGWPLLVYTGTLASFVEQPYPFCEHAASHGFVCVTVYRYSNIYSRTGFVQPTQVAFLGGIDGADGADTMFIVRSIYSGELSARLGFANVNSAAGYGCVSQGAVMNCLVMAAGASSFGFNDPLVSAIVMVNGNPQTALNSFAGVGLPLPLAENIVADVLAFGNNYLVDWFAADHYFERIVNSTHPPLLVTTPLYDFWHSLFTCDAIRAALVAVEDGTASPHDLIVFVTSKVGLTAAPFPATMPLLGVQQGCPGSTFDGIGAATLAAFSQSVAPDALAKLKASLPINAQRTVESTYRTMFSYAISFFTRSLKHSDAYNGFLGQAYASTALASQFITVSAPPLPAIAANPVDLDGKRILFTLQNNGYRVRTTDGGVVDTSDLGTQLSPAVGELLIGETYGVAIPFGGGFPVVFSGQPAFEHALYAYISTDGFVQLDFAPLEAIAPNVGNPINNRNAVNGNGAYDISVFRMSTIYSPANTGGLGGVYAKSTSDYLRITWRFSVANADIGVNSGGFPSYVWTNQLTLYPNGNIQMDYGNNLLKNVIAFDELHLAFVGVGDGSGKGKNNAVDLTAETLDRVLPAGAIFESFHLAQSPFKPSATSVAQLSVAAQQRFAGTADVCANYKYVQPAHCRIDRRTVEPPVR